jgi:zinc finger HIT domain-containing protein 1
VDPETRRQVLAQRLLTLEADNYEEPSLAATMASSGDGAYVDDDLEEEVVQGGSKTKKRKGRGGGGGSAATAAAGGAAAAASSTKERASKIASSSSSHHRIKNFEHVLAEEEYDSDTVNYKTIAADASSRPARQFCSVCGFFAAYTCTRCGLRFCGLRCQQTHKETRCLKFAE